MTPTLLELAQAGAHYGHHRSMVYPKARHFVYAIKNSVALINLEATLEGLTAAQKVVAQYRSEGKTILLVGTKRSVRQTVRDLGVRHGLPYVADRWLGGLLTNFESISHNIKQMNELKVRLESDSATALSKTDRTREQDRLGRLGRFLSGVSGLTKLPELLIIASASADKIAVSEANKLGIPIIAVTDTDVDPRKISYPIPANDDAPKTVELVLNALLLETPVVKMDEPETKIGEKKTKPIKKTTTKKMAKETAVAKK